MSNSRNVNTINVVKCRHKHNEDQPDYESSVSWEHGRITIHVHPGHDYEIDLMYGQSAREICNWLGQIAEKNWCSTELLGKLVMAFTYAVGDLRGLK